MTTRLLNATVMPAEGHYDLRRVDQVSYAESLMHSAETRDLVSYIGYEQTARHIESLLKLDVDHFEWRRLRALFAGWECPVSRERCVAEDGDVLLICRLAYRVQDPATKGEPQREEWEYFTCVFRTDDSQELDEETEPDLMP